MPFALLKILLSLGGAEIASRGGAALLRRLMMTGGQRVTPKLAEAAASMLGKTALAGKANSALASATSSAPSWLASRANTGTMARNMVEFGSSAGKMGLAMGGMIGTDYLMSGFGQNVDTEKSVDGWEMYQAQANPNQQENASAMSAMEQDAQMKHLQRAVNAFMAARREEQSGGMF